MTGAVASQEHINRAEKYIERLSKDMEELRGMESRLTTKIESINKNLTERIDANNKQTQNLVVAMIIGIAAMAVAISIAVR